MKFALALLALAALAACRSSMPSPDDMERYYKVAEKQAEGDISRLTAKRNSGAISEGEFETRAAAIRDSIPARASQLAWTRHELVESEKRSMGVPTGDHPVQQNAPSQSSGGSSFYHRAGDSGGQGYTGSNASALRGPQPGSLMTQ